MLSLRKALILCAAALVPGGLALSWIAGSAMVQGEPSVVPAAASPAQDIEIRSLDGLKLAGTYWPGRQPHSPSVLLLHGVKSSRISTAAGAARLASLGYAVLTIDFRGHGQSEMATRSFGLHEALDAQAAFDWLKKRQAGARVGIIGHSLGGAAALLGPRGPIPADALVLQAVYPDIRRAIRNRIAERLTTVPAYLLEPLLSFQSKPRFGVMPDKLSPLEALQRFHGPVFVMGGEDDRYTPPEETRALFAAAPGRKMLWLVPGRGHAAMGDLRDQAYYERLHNFLQQTIGHP
ncbi:alpha/beta fold hydrolase [Sphingomonas sp. LY54]|uniref:alpha/beta hydrolase n=1 Tax=Sphingomonas sp. LY54 TaxID=3095343 RepID=UPI002D76F6B1|nr:alpha/beta fold hydrolase [Sphingomonas sp. LY54]WRP28704.1 alpha/beta fold hydrolase [Sphingomonas sp. LY54]